MKSRTMSFDKILLDPFIPMLCFLLSVEIIPSWFLSPTQVIWSLMLRIVYMYKLFPSLSLNGPLALSMSSRIWLYIYNLKRLSLLQISCHLVDFVYCFVEVTSSCSIAIVVWIWKIQMGTWYHPIWDKTILICNIIIMLPSIILFTLFVIIWRTLNLKL